MNDTSMTKTDPRMLNAGEREAGALCTNCAAEIIVGNSVFICRDCGAVHHEACWRQRGDCCSFECAGEALSVEEHAGMPLTITSEELAATVPLPTRAPAHNFEMTADKKPVRRWNRTSLWAFALAVLGIPLFGLITGLIAILLACIALVTHRENRRGMGLAVAALLLGLFDVVGWAVGLSYYWGTPRTPVSVAELAIDASSLDELPEYIARAMRANVLIQIDAGIGRGGIGSGVVLKVTDNSSYIVTNRHVVDQHYSDATRSVPRNMSDLAQVMVTTVSQVSVQGVVEWMAPHGVDLAIVSAPLPHDDVQEAHWNSKAKPRIGDEVFAIGNPHGLGWTYTSGSVSQIRRQTHGSFRYMVLQTSAPINPGNSGGGLYDIEGNLLGINTLTVDKRFAEGISFSIALETLIDLIPDRFKFSSQNVEESDK